MREGTRADLDAIVADQTVLLVVVKDIDTIIGMATLYLMPQMGKRSGYVEDVVVDDTYRGQGLGVKLMESIISYAREMKLDSVHLTSRPSRVAANKLYVKLGFEKRDTNAYRLNLK
jgi:ribosomal protein S18 acetylase RimI-like enzyme